VAFRSLPAPLRAALRAAGAAVVILAGYALLLAARLALAPFARRRQRFTAWYFRHWSGVVLGMIGISVRASGEPPAPPFLMVANHLSYVDILVLASRLGCVFVSKAEVRAWPLLGPICRTVGTIFIDREARRDIPRVLAAIERELEGGRGVVLFPEGTVSAGRTVEAFKPPLLALAIRLGRPVHYAALGYRTPAGGPPASEAVCWSGGVPFARHAWGLLRLASVEAAVRFAPRPIFAADRKDLAERLRLAVLAELEAMARLEAAEEGTERGAAGDAGGEPSAEPRRREDRAAGAAGGDQAGDLGGRPGGEDDAVAIVPRGDHDRQAGEGADERHGIG
jgi:1-acyl-sn-glycerol-3-phosphate acyltransferase